MIDPRSEAKAKMSERLAAWRVAIAQTAEADDFDLARHVNCATFAAASICEEVIGPAATARWLRRLADHFEAAARKTMQ